MKLKEIMDFTTDSRVYKIAKRLQLESYEGICSRCHPNRGCNARRSRLIKKNWKEFRRTQYKTIDVNLYPIAPDLQSLRQGQQGKQHPQRTELLANQDEGDGVGDHQHQSVLPFAGAAPENDGQVCATGSPVGFDIADVVDHQDVDRQDACGGGAKPGERRQ